MAKATISENSLNVLNYLKANAGENLTAADIAEALGLEKKQVDGIVTSGLQKRGLTERVPAVIEVEEGVTKDVKFIKITDAGLAYDHAAAQAQDEAAKSAE